MAERSKWLVYPLDDGNVRYSDINTFGNHQTRVDDLDPQHVSNLKDQIQTNGLSKIPYVEWNEEEESFVPLSGHHRIQAFHNINVDSYGKDDDTSLIPVCVVEFYDDIEREVFLQRENTKGPTSWLPPRLYLPDGGFVPEAFL